MRLIGSAARPQAGDMDTARSKQPPPPAQSSSPAQPWKHPLASILAAQSQPAAAGGVQAVEGWGCPEVLDWLDGARLGGSEHAAGGAALTVGPALPGCLGCKGGAGVLLF